MILTLSYKPRRHESLVNVTEMDVSPNGIDGAVYAAPMRHVLIVPLSTLNEFSLRPGDLRENLVIDDSAIGNLHAMPSGTILSIGTAHIRLSVHCEPCGRLGKLVDIRKIVHKRGYLGTFLTRGTLRLGAEVRRERVAGESIPYDLRERIAWYLAKQKEPVEVTKLVNDIGLSMSYCRAIPSLTRNIKGIEGMIVFRSRSKGSRPDLPKPADQGRLFPVSKQQTTIET
jgi:MOSC domain-containing protein YiiM